MIGVEDWSEIRWLHRAEGMSIKRIARHPGIARNSVRRAVASDDPPKYRRAPRGSIVDAVEPAIRELLAQYPRMPASVIAERIGGSPSARSERAEAAAARADKYGHDEWWRS